MWYSSYSTGILDVDNQHANIDALTKLYAEDSDQEAKWLDMLFQSIRFHFSFEENLFGEHFPDTHRQRHRQLINDLGQLVALRQRGEITKKQTVEVFRETLVCHVTDFDLDLRDMRATADGLTPPETGARRLETGGGYPIPDKY